MEIRTLRTTANQCPDIVNCPAVDVIDAHPERVYFIGNVETDPRISTPMRAASVRVRRCSGSPPSCPRRSLHELARP